VLGLIGSVFGFALGLYGQNTELGGNEGHFPCLSPLAERFPIDPALDALHCLGPDRLNGFAD
jgi:hypothetical protein